MLAFRQYFIIIFIFLFWYKYFLVLFPFSGLALTRNTTKLRLSPANVTHKLMALSVKYSARTSRHFRKRQQRQDIAETEDDDDYAYTCVDDDDDDVDNNAMANRRIMNNNQNILITYIHGYMCQ